MRTLLVLLGPTGVGKTDLSIQLAHHFKSPIVSADSRQIYREMKIGTAIPNAEQLAAVSHYFIGVRSIFDDYTAGKYEIDVLNLFDELFPKHPFIWLVGGSGLYIDAVCRGIDAIPATNNSLRKNLMEHLEKEGLESLRFELRKLDPDIFEIIDIKNPQRVLRALEVCITSGKPYSQLRDNFSKNRDFRILKIGLNIPRDELYNRINQRVDLMMEQGLLDEAKNLYPYWRLNALKTVGYKELFEYLHAKISLDMAVEQIKRNTRHYAKRQLSWFARYDDIEWFTPADTEKIITYISSKL
ncbi:MAG: tRNA (adenosine(37)-N6)-dimethylallyltransferase MiaA [Prevotellaceae bacterium]|jgi:tRNA dimethylallyltransferase|nr:tRNA (adenosine(37)-N6)-dimethylallyltransferase MiaA [Prevotellaceae bacterium]